MKIRTDFVSNSSSSSYVFSANFKKFYFGDFVKAVCEACDGGDGDKRVYENNEAVLKYCLKYFELLHLGRLAVGRKKDVIKREAQKDEFYSEFDSIKQMYIDSRPEYDDDHVVAKMVDSDTIECEYDDIAPDNIVVMRQYMTDVIRCKHWEGGRMCTETENRTKRVQEILKVVNAVKGISENAWKTPFGASTYLITKNTVSNTRDLIAAGYDVRLEKWENLDALEARLAAGETVFHIECGDSGEGEDDMRLFSNVNQYPFENVPLEQICGGY